MKCKLCNLKIERQDFKVHCTDCIQYLHAKCARLEKSDVEYMEGAKQHYRCDTCAVIRRKSNMMTSIPILPTQITSDVIHNKTNNVDNISDIAVVDSNLMVTSKKDEVTLSMLYSEILKLQQINADALIKIKQLEDKTDYLSNRVDFLESRLNIFEQKRKNCSIDIVGMPSAIATENLTDNVIKLISNGVGETIAKNDIEFCFNKNIKPKNKRNGSNIVYVKFATLEIKQNIMKKIYSRKIKLTADVFGNEFRQNNNNIYINDSLTKYSRGLLERAKLLKNDNKCKYVWTRHSTILVRIKEGDKVLKIKSYGDFSKLIT